MKGLMGIMKGFSPEAAAAMVAASAILLFALMLFGFAGFKALAVFMLVFLVPAYAIINNLNLTGDEKLFFALFISLGVFPISVWILNRLVPSFRLSTVMVFAVAVALGFGLRLVRRAR